MWLGYIQQRSPPHSKPFSNNHLVPPLSKYIELEFDWLEPYFSRGKNQFYGILGFVDGCMQVTRLSHTVPSTKTLFWIRQLSSSLLNCWNDIFWKTCCNGYSHGFQYAKKTVNCVHLSFITFNLGWFSLFFANFNPSWISFA